MRTPPVCNYEGSDYQQKFWEQGNRAYEDAAEALAIQKLLRESGKHLLELGAGTGRNTERYIGFEHITLLDYSTSQLRQAIAKLGTENYRYVAADIYRLPFAPNSFDGATMIRTLHHFSEPQAALQQVGRVLTGQSVFLLEFANKRNLKSILRSLLGRQSWNPFNREAVEFAALNFDFHPASMKEMLSQSGFHTEKQICVSYMRAGLLKRLLPLRGMITLEKMLQSAFSWAAYSPSVFLRTRTSGDKLALVENDLFQCPACGHFPIQDTPPELVCPQCERKYIFQDGIYDFRIDNAEKESHG